MRNEMLKWSFTLKVGVLEPSKHHKNLRLGAGGIPTNG
jgi:hypothetical protein